MLGKLLKHEWKAVWKVPMLLFGILMIMAVMAGLTFSLPIWDSEWIGLPLSGVMLLMMFYFALIGVSVGVSIYFAVRYYRNMFTDEGYLTHTLPVTSHQLLLSKVITMCGWQLISGIAVIISLILFGGVTFLSLVPKDSSFAREMVDFFSELMQALPELWRTPELRGINGFCASIVVMMLTGTFSGTMTVIGSVTLGQMVRGHRILGSVGAYFAIQTIMQIVTTLLILPLMMMRIETFDYYIEDSPFFVMTPMYFVMAVIALAVGLGLYFLSEYLIRKRLELE